MDIIAAQSLRDQTVKEMQEMFGENLDNIRQLYKSITAINTLKREIVGIQTQPEWFNTNQDKLIINRIINHEEVEIDQFDLLDKTNEQIIAMLDELIDIKQRQLITAAGDGYETFIKKETEYSIRRKAGCSKLIVVRCHGSLPADFDIRQTLAQQSTTTEFSELEVEDCLMADVTGSLDFKFDQWSTNPEGKSALIIRTGQSPGPFNTPTPNMNFLLYARRMRDFVQHLFIKRDRLPYDYIVLYGTTSEVSVFLANEAFEIDAEGNLKHLRSRYTHYTYLEAMMLVDIGKHMRVIRGYTNPWTVYKDFTNGQIYLIDSTGKALYVPSVEDMESDYWIIVENTHVN